MKNNEMFDLVFVEFNELEDSVLHRRLSRNSFLLFHAL